MSIDAHKNFAYSTIATAPAPASSGTSLVVAAGDGAKFPAASFNATVWPANTQPTTANAEIVRVTVVATDTFTITRGQESSAARSIIVGDQIAATITAKTLTDVETVLAAQSANAVYAGPISGSSAVPAFRALDPLDLSPTFVRTAAQFDKTSATLADVTGLTFTLVAAKTYRFRAWLNCTVDATGGAKVGTGGTATATAINVSSMAIANGVSPGVAQATALGVVGSYALGGATTGYVIYIDGTIVVNAGGTLTIQFAQASANNTSSVLVGSTFEMY